MLERIEFGGASDENSRPAEAWNENSDRIFSHWYFDPSSSSLRIASPDLNMGGPILLSSRWEPKSHSHIPEGRSAGGVFVCVSSMRTFRTACFRKHQVAAER